MARIRESPKVAPPAPKPPRLASLDALRGACMLMLACSGIGLQYLVEHFHFRRDFGATFASMLAPAFLVIAGIALPFSYAARQSKGYGRQLLHAALRTAALIALGMYFDSYLAEHRMFDLRGQLQILGLAYFFAFLLLPLGVHVQALAVLFLLGLHTTAYVVYGSVQGFDAWSSPQNVGVALDLWLGLIPQDDYSTLVLLPAVALVLLGVLAGELLRGELNPTHKALILAGAGLAGMLLGWLLSGGGWIGLSWPALIPFSSSICSASFVLFVAGLVVVLLVPLSLLLDSTGWHHIGLPLALVGRNSLAFYTALILFFNWARITARLLLPSMESLAPHSQMLTELGAIALFWLLALWLYRRRIFLTL